MSGEMMERDLRLAQEEIEALKKDNHRLAHMVGEVTAKHFDASKEIEALKAENKTLSMQLGDAVAKQINFFAEIEALKAQIDEMSGTFTSKESIVQDAKRWKYACDNWTFLIKKYMRSGFEGPRLEELVEFWSAHDNAAMEAEK